MSKELFANIVGQAVKLGFSNFWLTPMLGEVFADPNCEERFCFLEQTSGVQTYGFYTNFILPREKTIRGFSKLTKFTALHISIYGHDRESFQQVTRKPPLQYDRLLKNLSTLEETLAERVFPGGLHFSIRTLGGTNIRNLPETDVTRRLRRIVDRYGATIMVADVYDTWGGTVTPEDVREVGIKLTDGNGIYMHGACTLLFSSPQVTSDGTVHACACRDVDGSLTIGNLWDEPLVKILSMSNPAYRQIIESQQNSIYSSNCRSCSMYRSIYDHRPAGGDSKFKSIRFHEALELMEVGDDPAENN